MSDSGCRSLNLGLLALAELLAMSLWFSASAVVPQLTAEFSLTPGEASWMTMSVQGGFVVGALLSAVLNAADRIDARYLFAASALFGAGVNTLITVTAHTDLMLMMRFLTGAAMAGVYPPGMKIVTTFCKKDRGFGIGVLVGALTLGSAMPHLLNGISIGGEELPPWQYILWGTSILAVIGAVIVALLVKNGPYEVQSAPFNWKYAFKGFAYKPTRLANFGYLGHMWELYAMWTWVPLFLLASYQQAGFSEQWARIAGFGAIGIGSIGCVLAGSYADRFGRTTITIISLLVSGSCVVLSGFLFYHPLLVTALCLVWGLTVVSDSAQFSTAVTELGDPRYIGTALTIQTCSGFLLTMVSIRILPSVVEWLGWNYAFLILVIGPIFGIWSMYRLRFTPEAVKMASGAR